MDDLLAYYNIDFLFSTAKVGIIFEIGCTKTRNGVQNRRKGCTNSHNLYTFSWFFNCLLVLLQTKKAKKRR